MCRSLHMKTVVFPAFKNTSGYGRAEQHSLINVSDVMW